MTDEEKLGWDEMINKYGMNDIEKLMEICIDIIELSRAKQPPISIPFSQAIKEQSLKDQQENTDK